MFSSEVEDANAMIRPVRGHSGASATDPARGFAWDAPLSRRSRSGKSYSYDWLHDWIDVYTTHADIHEVVLRRRRCAKAAGLLDRPSRSLELCR